MTKDKDQLERFKEAARAAGCSDDEAAFKRALTEIAKAPPQHVEKAPKKKSRKR